MVYGAKNFEVVGKGLENLHFLGGVGKVEGCVGVEGE